MRNLATLALAALVTFSACKKTEQQPKEMLDISTLPDIGLPTKNAKWVIELNSYGDIIDPFIRMYYHPNKDFFMGMDTTVHTYISVATTGTDTVVNGKVYHGYNYKAWTKCTHCSDIDTNRVTDNIFYLREDPLTKVIYRPGAEETVLMDFADSSSKGMVHPFYSWPDMQVQPPYYMRIGHYKTRVWNMQNPNDKHEYFYRAEGIGGILGLLGDLREHMGYAHMRSIDFSYDNDSVHFEYPLN